MCCYVDSSSMRYWAWSALARMICPASRLMLRVWSPQVSSVHVLITLQVSPVYLRMYSVPPVCVCVPPPSSYCPQRVSRGKPRNALRRGLNDGDRCIFMAKVTFLPPPPSLSLCALLGRGGMHDMTGMQDASCAEEGRIYCNGVTNGVLQGKSLSKDTD